MKELPPLTNYSIGVLKETDVGEQRCSISPDATAKLVKQGYFVKVQTGAGATSNFSDAEYVSAGATIGTLDEVSSFFFPLSLKKQTHALFFFRVTPK